MFPYLTTGLKKVWAAITALQSSLANVQSSLANVQGNSIGFVDYNNIQTPNVQTSPSLNPVSRGLYLFYIDGGSTPTSVSIYVNGTGVFGASVRDNDSFVIPLYFEGGETVEINRSNKEAGVSVSYIPFKTS